MTNGMFGCFGLFFNILVYLMIDAGI